jgi:hypothetical protein
MKTQFEYINPPVDSASLPHCRATINSECTAELRITVELYTIFKEVYPMKGDEKWNARLPVREMGKQTERTRFRFLK